MSKAPIGKLNYIFDYDLNHITTRVTDLKYCFKETHETVLCAEITALGSNNIDDGKNEIDKIIQKCKEEISQISNQFNNSDLGSNINEVEAVTAPKTYRIPLLGYSEASTKFNDDVLEKFKGKVTVFPWMHTRKEMLESLKGF